MLRPCLAMNLCDRTLEDFSRKEGDKEHLIKNEHQLPTNINCSLYFSPSHRLNMG